MNPFECIVWNYKALTIRYWIIFLEHSPKGRACRAFYFMNKRVQYKQYHKHLIIDKISVYSWPENDAKHLHLVK